MNYSLLLALGFFFSSSIAALPIDKVVYGNDDRRRPTEINDLKGNLLKLSQSTAAMVEWGNFHSIAQGKVKLTAKSLRREEKLCSGEKFEHDIVAAGCTGFLVGKDLLMTAGHCIETIEECRENAWVFDFKSNDSVIDYDKNVFKCVGIVEQVFEAEELDYAIIKLDRKVQRPVLKIREEAQVSDNVKLALAGYPSGTPQKIITGAKILDNSNENFFVANLDTFGGNSGSPVIDEKSGVVEGILVRGEDDYVYDKDRACYIVNTCSEDGNEGCDGEEVVRTSQINLKAAKRNYQGNQSYYKIVNKIKKNPSMINELNDLGVTPLIDSVVKSRQLLFRRLLRFNNIDLSVKSSEGLNVFDYLLRENSSRNISMFKYILKKNPNFLNFKGTNSQNLLMNASRHGRESIVDWLLKNPDVEIGVVTPTRGWSASFIAARYGHQAIFKKLVAHGEMMELADIDGWNALMMTSRYHKYSFARYLVESAKFDINGGNKFGWTPLMLSVMNRNKEVFSYLAHLNGIDLNRQRNNGDTAAHIAAINKDFEKLKILQSLGADLSIRNKRGDSVNDIIKKYKY